MKIDICLLLLICGALRGFAAESRAEVIKIINYPGRSEALQVFLDEDGDFLWDKRLDLYAESVQQVLKDTIKENGGVIYETEGLKSDYFTSSRLLAVVLPNGKTIEVLDLFPHLNDTALKFTFPYAWELSRRGNYD